MPQLRCFLSYSVADEPLVEQVAEALQQRGIVPWFSPWDASVGETFTRTLPEEIRATGSLALFLSPSSVKSPWVNFEIAKALDLKNNNHLVLPIFCGDRLALVKQVPLLADAWLTPQGDAVNRLGVDIPAGTAADPHLIADRLRDAIFTKQRTRDTGSALVVIDQRGSGHRKGPLKELPERLADANWPILVFRPNSGERSRDQVLDEAEWSNFAKNVCRSLSTALPLNRGDFELHILPRAELSLGALLGRQFSRTYRGVTLYTHSVPFRGAPVSLGVAYANFLDDPRATPEQIEAAPWSEAPLPTAPQPKLAVFVGAQKTNPEYALQAHEFLADTNPMPVVWLPLAKFIESTEDALSLVKRLGGVIAQYRVQELHLFSAGPDYLIPLLTGLQQKVRRIYFYENNRSAADVRHRYYQHNLDLDSQAAKVTTSNISPGTTTPADQEPATAEIATSYLYRAQVQGIQAWILRTGRLKDIVGASEVIDGFAAFADNKLKGVGVTGDKIIQNAAGAIEVEFPDRRTLERFATHWPMWVAQRAPGLAVHHAWLERSQAPEQNQEREHLMGLLQAAQSRLEPALPEVGPLVARSGRTGAAAVQRDHDGALDAPARAARAQLSGARSRFEEDLLLKHQSFATEIDQFPEGYFGVIHADINSLGAFFRSFGDNAQDRRMASEKIRRIVTEAVKGALQRFWPKQTLVPARPIVLGGDDFSIIVPGAEALEFTQTFLELFDDKVRFSIEDLRQPVFMAAGVALVKPGWPFSDGHDLAEKLCSATKDRFRGKNASGLTFYRATAALAEDWKDIVEHQLTGPAGILTGGPYAVQELPLLARLAIAAQPFRGKIREWGGTARQNSAHAQRQWDRLLEVGKETKPEALEQLRHALRALNVDPKTGWRGSGADAQTPLLDALEWVHVNQDMAS